jgi:hypothetical protein
VPVDLCDVAGTCGCDASVLDAGPGKSRALGSPLAHAVNAVCWSDSSTRSPHTLHWSHCDCDGGYHVDVTVDLHSCGRLCVDAVVSVQHAAAADGSVSSLSCRPLRMMVLLLSRRPLLVTAAVDVAGSDARTLLAHRAVMRLVVSGRWIRLSRSNVQLPPLTASPHYRHTVLVRGCCSYLDGSPSMMPQSTLVCPAVVDASLLAQRTVMWLEVC